MREIVHSWRHRAAVLALGLAALAAPAQEVTPTPRPFLWRFQADGAQHYLYGTMHLGDERITTLPESVETAREKVDALFTEIRMENPGPALLRKMLLPGGQTLPDVLPEDLFARLQAYGEEKGLPIAAFQRMKVWVVATQLSLMEVMQELAGKEALDAMLYNDAEASGKAVGELETIDGQFEAMDSFTLDEQVAMLDGTLEHLVKEGGGKAAMEKLLDVYLQGDASALLDFSVDYYRDDPALWKRFEDVMLVKRNATMVRRILEETARHPGRSCFFAVGAMHYPGPHGILQLLRDRGIEIVRLDGKGQPLDERQLELDRLRRELAEARARIEALEAENAALRERAGREPAKAGAGRGR